VYMQELGSCLPSIQSYFWQMKCISDRTMVDQVSNSHPCEPLANLCYPEANIILMPKGFLAVLSEPGEVDLDEFQGASCYSTSLFFLTFNPSQTGTTTNMSPCVSITSLHFSRVLDTKQPMTKSRVGLRCTIQTLRPSFNILLILVFERTGVPGKQLLSSVSMF